VGLVIEFGNGRLAIEKMNIMYYGALSKIKDEVQRKKLLGILLTAQNKSADIDKQMRFVYEIGKICELFKAMMLSPEFREYQEWLSNELTLPRGRFLVYTDDEVVILYNEKYNRFKKTANCRGKLRFPEYEKDEYLSHTIFYHVTKLQMDYLFDESNEYNHITTEVRAEDYFE